MRFFGGLLMAVGILIMTCSGLCSAFVIVNGFGAIVHDASALMWPLVFGGLPFAAGFALYMLGASLVRASRRPPRD